MSVEVTVKLFANLREGRFDAKTMDLAEGSSPATVIAELGLAQDAVTVVFVNSRHADKDQVLRAGDVLGLFPPRGRWLNVASLGDVLADGAKGGLVPWATELEASRAFGLGIREVEAAALALGMRPSRYARNGTTIDLAGQRRLHAARVAVVGCGGLGGYLLEELARAGVGCLVAVDGDIFEETNLNRQLLATIDSLGRPKAEVAAERIALINPAVIVRARRARLDASNADELLEGCDAVADGLDSVPSRLVLAAACDRLGIPLAHGSIAGWFGLASTQLPGGKGLRELYADAGASKGIELALGNPAFTPAIAASLEAAEICKLLTGLAPSLAGRLLSLDLRNMEFARFEL